MEIISETTVQSLPTVIKGGLLGCEVSNTRLLSKAAGTWQGVYSFYRKKLLRGNGFIIAERQEAMGQQLCSHSL